MKTTGVRVQDVCTAVLGGFSGSLSVSTGLLLPPVKGSAAAPRTCRPDHGDGKRRRPVDEMALTTTGEQALADGTVAQKLAPAAG